MQGDLTLNGVPLSAADGRRINDVEPVSIVATRAARLFVFAGESLAEPAIARGPFFMTGDADLNDAFRRFRVGKMGVLAARPADASTDEVDEAFQESFPASDPPAFAGRGG